VTARSEASPRSGQRLFPFSDRYLRRVTHRRWLTRCRHRRFLLTEGKAYEAVAHFGVGLRAGARWRTACSGHGNAVETNRRA